MVQYVMNMNVTNSSGQWDSHYKYKGTLETPCPSCGIRGAHYCPGPTQSGCLFENLDKDKVYGLVCNCPKCQVTS